MILTALFNSVELLIRMKVCMMRENQSVMRDTMISLYQIKEDSQSEPVWKQAEKTKVFIQQDKKVSIFETINA